MILFLGSVIVTTVIEHITGWVLEKLFHLMVGLYQPSFAAMSALSFR